MMPQSGFGNYHQSEAIAGALPSNQNSPQHCPHGLYAEQLSGTAFTRPRHANLHSWLYRKLPSVAQKEFHLHPKQICKPFVPTPPNPLRWSPQPLADIDHDLLDGLFHIAGNALCQVYLYSCNQSMEKRFWVNHDGDLLFVPYQGKILLMTELGNLSIKTGTIAVIPRGIKFKVILQDNFSQGYICENRQMPFTLPNLGSIGANGLANPRHFIYPDATFESNVAKVDIICKYQNRWWLSSHNHSPLDVVAWHGNYAPYSYDLSLFNTISSVSFDHPDPSIFTVLTSESNTPGVANLDFVIFPSRWMVAEHTFRPPYFHRNIMSEFMGLLHGQYDAKKEGFLPGGYSIHNSMSAHGPDVTTYQQAVEQTLEPEKYANTLAFMFESRKPFRVTEQAMTHISRQKTYSQCWQGFVYLDQK